MTHTTDQLLNMTWRWDDATDQDLSLFDWLNIALCAQRRAESAAGQGGKAFYREYQTVKALTRKAAKY